MKLSEKSEALIYSIFINGLIIGGTYYYVQPDDKGIGFGLFSAVYGFLSALSGLILHLKKWSSSWSVKCLIMVANLSNLFWIYQLIYSLRHSFYENINAISVPLYLFSMYGCFVSIKLLYEYLKS
jgi:hypothetical protein